MRFSEVLAASLLAPLAAAHGSIPGAPKIFGLPKDIKIRDPTPRAVRQVEGPQLNPRQGGQNGRCGPSFGNAACAAGFCCSGAGYCGTSKDHCAAPDCLIDFGPACDANKTPSGASTRNDPRPQKGNVAYGGEGIYGCLKPGTVAITYDDGPYIYTDEVLNKFKAAGFKATFFITGNNLGKGAIDQQWSAVIKRMIAEGHQVASHTWSHQDLSVITESQRYDQMIKNEMAFRNIIGKYPTYMRPPYSSCNGACQNVMKALGYVVSYFDLDTDDYNQLTKEKIQTAKNNFKSGLASVQPATGDRLAIAHDIHELTALNLTTYMIEHLQARGFKGVTMGECMNEPEANWYRTPGGGTPTTTTPGSTPTGGSGSVSTDGSCGGTKGFKCTGSSFGNCCSQYGWCGSTSDHCGTGCNSVFGTCGSSTPKPTSTPLKTSPDGTCGGSTGNTCVGFVHNGVKSECCSQYGYCGNSADHCGGGCNASAGTCKVSTPSLSDSPISDISQSPSISVDTLSSGSVSSTLLSNDQDFTAGPVPTTSRSTNSVAITSATADQTVAPPSTGTSVVQPVESSVTTLVTSPTATNGATSPSKPAPSSTSTVSMDGKCGGANGKTCKGYANSMGWKLECCSKQFGRCSNDAWSCSFGCNRQSGQCWF